MKIRTKAICPATNLSWAHASKGPAQTAVAMGGDRVWDPREWPSTHSDEEYELEELCGQSSGYRV